MDIGASSALTLSPAGEERGSAEASKTIDAVAGRISALNPTGSDLSGSNLPDRLKISYLYLSPARAPGTKISQ